MRKATDLTPEVQTYIVQALACHDAPSIVARSVKEEFGLDLSRQRVEAYDPTKRAGKDLAKRWRELFEATRKAFQDETTEIGISHRSVRLRTLQRLATQAETRGTRRLRLPCEQAAKEMGDAYTNTRVSAVARADGAQVPRRLLWRRRHLARRSQADPRFNRPASATTAARPSIRRCGTSGGPRRATACCTAAARRRSLGRGRVRDLPGGQLQGPLPLHPAVPEQDRRERLHAPEDPDRALRPEPSVHDHRQQDRLHNRHRVGVHLLRPLAAHRRDQVA
jgi:hypothetical protein